MNRYLAFFLGGMMAVSLAACGESENQENSQPSSASSLSQSSEPEQAPSSEQSQPTSSATEQTPALSPIWLPNPLERSCFPSRLQERNADVRPELTTLPENLDAYDVIFLGFPNWWGDMPMAMYSFLEQVDLSGKTIVPFVTSGGSGFSSTISTIEDMESAATVQEGLSLRDSSAAGAQ